MNGIFCVLFLYKVVRKSLYIHFRKGTPSWRILHKAGKILPKQSDTHGSTFMLYRCIELIVVRMLSE